MTEQKDPDGKDAHTGGAKLDAGKPKICIFFDEYFPHAIEAVTQISTFGAIKYSPGGWKTVPDGYDRYTEAMRRHYSAVCKGEMFDDETKLPHDYQIAWNALARLEIGLKEGRYGMKLSKPDAKVFVEALLEPYIGKEIPNDRKLAKSVVTDIEYNMSFGTEFNPNAAAYIDINGVTWMPVKDEKKSIRGVKNETVLSVKPYHAQDMESRKRDALSTPDENPDLGKAVAQSVSEFAENIKKGFAKYKKVSPVNKMRDQLNDDYDQAQIKKLP